MKFHSKAEAITYALMKLNKLNHKYKDAKEITHCIDNLKIAFENHEQNLEVICQHLDIIKPILSKDDLRQLITLQTIIKHSHYQLTPTEKFANPLGRRSESELFILLLLSPTKAMMDSVNRVSIEILKAIDYLSKNDTKELQDFLSNLEESSHIISFGSYKKAPPIEEVIALLKSNDPKKLPEIMFIHFKFGQAMSRNIPITNAPVRAPIGKLSEVIQDIWKGKPEDFFKDGISKNTEESKRYRSYIADEKIYSSILYTTESNKGRLGPIRKRCTNQLGLMLPCQQTLSKNLPQYSSSWIPDCIGQTPDLDSQYVKDSIDNDTVYISGPSGMASVLLGQMEFMANFEDIKLKQNYLTAISSYIVGGGYHSLHEVIGPAEYCLNLVPGYHIAPPQKGKLASPPNYHTYFAQQAKIDPEFNNRREDAWKNYLTFFQDSYLQKKHNNKPVSNTLETKEITDPSYQSIMNELNRYIESRGHAHNNQIGLNLTSRLFRNSKLTTEKIKNATLLKSLVTNIFNSTKTEQTFDKLFKLISDFKELDETLELKFNKSYTCCTKSGFAKSLDNIEKLIITNAVTYPFSY